MLNRYILDNISYKLDAGLTLSDMQSAATVSDYLMLSVYQGLSRQRERIGDEEAYEQFVREATLKAVDDGWVELIDYLEQLKYAVAGRASAQRNVMFEYQNEAFESIFGYRKKRSKCNIIRNILLSDVKIGRMAGCRSSTLKGYYNINSLTDTRRIIWYITSISE